MCVSLVLLYELKAGFINISICNILFGHAGKQVIKKKGIGRMKSV